MLWLYSRYYIVVLVGCYKDELMGLNYMDLDGDVVKNSKSLALLIWIWSIYKIKNIITMRLKKSLEIENI